MTLLAQLFARATRVLAMTLACSSATQKPSTMAYKPLGIITPFSDLRYSQTHDYTTAHRRKNYRFNTYGSDAATFVLDARSFRAKDSHPSPIRMIPSRLLPFLSARLRPVAPCWSS